MGLDGVNGVGTAEIGYYEQGMACDFCHVHPTRKDLNGMLPYKLEDHFDAVITTRRHPRLILATAKRMAGKPYDENATEAELLAMDKSATAELASQFKSDWTTLGEEAAKYSKSLYLDITGPTENRLPQLTAIAEHFGKGHMVEAIQQYAYAWKPVNQTLTVEDMDAIAEVVDEYEQWQS